MEKLGINEPTVKLTNCETNWVITVPAIWSNGSKQFMREAAIAVSYYLVNLI